MERTLNMALMSVTLDVSKLRGWLKADPNTFTCRVERRAPYDICGPEGGRVCGVWRQHKRHTRGEDPTQGWGGTGHARSARRT